MKRPILMALGKLNDDRDAAGKLLFQVSPKQIQDAKRWKSDVINRLEDVINEVIEC